LSAWCSNCSMDRPVLTTTMGGSWPEIVLREGKKGLLLIGQEIRNLFLAMRNKDSTARVEQLPNRTHLTFGGRPSRKLRWRKSASFVTTAKPCSEA